MYTPTFNNKKKTLPEFLSQVGRPNGITCHTGPSDSVSSLTSVLCRRPCLPGTPGTLPGWPFNFKPLFVLNRCGRSVNCKPHRSRDFTNEMHRSPLTLALCHRLLRRDGPCSFLIGRRGSVCKGLKFPGLPETEEKGKIFTMDLNEPTTKPTELRMSRNFDLDSFNPHGISVFPDEKTGTGPAHHHPMFCWS